MGDRRAGLEGPRPLRPADIRNVVVLGPSGAGKTTLVEHLLLAAGAIPRLGRVEDGTTTCDDDPAAVRQHRSVGLAVASFDYGATVITLIDTPGHPDFMGDVRAGLRAADAALFVVSSVDGIDAGTAVLWDECEAVGLPRVIVVTKLDKEQADFEETIAVCHRLFTGSGGVLPMYLPVHADDGRIAGFIDLLTTRIHHWDADGPHVRDAEGEHLALVAGARDELIEAIITESEDESLMDRFIAGEPLGADVLLHDLERAVARGHFHPVLAHATHPVSIGSAVILDVIARGLPSPAERLVPVVKSMEGEPRGPLQADPDGLLCAEVIKTASDPDVGKVSIVRVFSGTLVPDQAVHVCGHVSAGSGRMSHDSDERIGQLGAPLGSQLRPVTQAIAGSIVSVARLPRAETADTLSDPGEPLLMEAWPMPEPLLPIGIATAGPADEDRLGQALARMLAEDPTLRLEHGQDSGQIVLWCLGDAHADLVIDRLRTRHGISVQAQKLRLTFRETFASNARGTGRLMKESGGDGQSAIIEISVEPLPAGAGFEFVDAVTGGTVPREFIGSVEQGVRQQMSRGLVAGYPVVDIRVTLLDGRAHIVDSSDQSFRTAGAHALQDAAQQAEIAILEPILTISVTVPDEHVGAVLSDLASRRAHVTGTVASGDGRVTVAASAPEIELARYAVDIRSIAHGLGTYHRARAGYAPMPPTLARKVRAES